MVPAEETAPAETTAARAYDAVRRAIVSGELAMGERLGELELASQLGVSRTPVREALRRLSSEGLVELESNRGAKVKTWSPDEVDEVFALRALLEGYGAGLAAARISQEQLARLVEISGLIEASAHLRTSDSYTAMHELNSEFHGIVLSASGSARLPALASSVIQLPSSLGVYRKYTEAAMRRSQQHHREIIDALSAGDPEWCTAAMRTHVLAGRSEAWGWTHQ